MFALLQCPSYKLKEKRDYLARPPKNERARVTDPIERMYTFLRVLCAIIRHRLCSPSAHERPLVPGRSNI